MDHVYKGQLQTYALRHNLELPVYATEREGPPHAPRFRCKVTFSGQTFQSQDFFPTLKSAEHAAAKIALDSLALLSQEGTDVAYKNLLQEIAQKENAPLPLYTTVTSGPSHAPTFSSTVEFAGKVFSGEEAKTKKLAELNAAKVAFTSVRNGNSSQTASPSLPCERQEAANLNVKSSPQKIHSQPSKLVTPDIPSKWIEVYEDEPELPDVLNAPASIAKEMTIASPVPENPTDVCTLTAPATNGMKMNIAASSSPLRQNPTNDCNETSSSTMYLPRLDSSSNPTSSSSVTQKRLMPQGCESGSKLRRLNDAVEEDNATRENSLDPESKAGLEPHTTQPKVEEETQKSSATQKLSAKSQLYTLCSTRHWKAPIYESFAEGPCNRILFTCKATVEVKEDSQITVLEFFGNPHQEKKIAAEHAAEAALWYLNNVQTEKASGRQGKTKQI